MSVDIHIVVLDPVTPGDPRQRQRFHKHVFFAFKEKNQTEKKTTKDKSYIQNNLIIVNLYIIFSVHFLMHKIHVCFNI